MGRKTRRQHERKIRRLRGEEIVIDDETSVQMRSEATRIIKEIKEGAPDIPKPTAAQKEIAVKRLKALTELLQAKPKPILEQLTEIGVPFEKIENVAGHPEFDTVVIKMEDIKKADQDLISRGTLYDQMYGKVSEKQ